jgi:hypothetical protein
MFDPNSLEYCHGYGYKEEEVKESIRKVVQEGGEISLNLNDKPALKAKILRFAFDAPAIKVCGAAGALSERTTG